MGIAHRTYASYERNERTPDATALLGLLREGWNANWLLTGEGPERIDPSETAPQCDSQPARLDEAKLAEALAIIDRALVLTRRRATPMNKARLVVMAYTVLVEEEQVSTALERIMQGVDAEISGETNDAP